MRALGTKLKLKNHLILEIKFQDKIAVDYPIVPY